MAIDYFPEFVREYMLCAGWSGGDDEARMLTWLPGMERNSVTREEAKAALARMQEAGFPLARANHFSVFLANVRSVRAEAFGREKAERLKAVGGCDVCSGSGLVEVPHPRYFDEEGRWHGKVFAVVLCQCPAGEKFASMRLVVESIPRPLMTLIDYETRVCANWKEWLDWWQAERLIRLSKSNPVRPGRRSGNPFAAAVKRAEQKSGERLNQ